MMKINRLKFIWQSAFLALILLAGSAGAGYCEGRQSVFVSILPQKYFVQQIGKDRVNVQVMVAPGASPATYEPRPRQMAALSAAGIYFAIGVPFEKAWLEKISAANPSMTIVRTDMGIEKRAMERHHHDDEHEHGHEYHSANKLHGTPDPHIWLSPRLVKQQAGTIADALKEADPADAAAYEANYKAFVFDIDKLDMELKHIFAGKKGQRFMVFHPSWGYLARDYGLIQVPVEIEGKDPKPAHLKKIISQAREENIRVVFVQPQFSTRSAERIAHEISGKVIAVDPLAENWAENIRQVARIMAEAMKP